MAYKIIVSLSAEKEIETAINYYSDISVDVPLKFITEVEKIYTTLSHNPYFRMRFKNFRTVPVKGFPFMLFYEVNEDKQQVTIYSCFHTSKSPRRYPQ